ANVDLSHEIFYDTSAGDVTQFNHHIEVNLLDAALGVIGSDNDTVVKMLAADIRVPAARGTYGGTKATLFEGAGNVRFQVRGTVGGGAADVLNVPDAAFSDVEPGGDVEEANVHLNGGHRILGRRLGRAADHGWRREAEAAGLPHRGTHPPGVINDAA